MFVKDDAPDVIANDSRASSSHCNVSSGKFFCFPERSKANTLEGIRKTICDSLQNHFKVDKK
ncbi:MAG: hypothetical protein C0514_08350 [Candidatus Puniceispirillum sp.]|nr:hypothetical protein [Candidatus Puniceispirillum sp.]